MLTAAYGSVAPHQNYALTFQGDRCTLVTGLGSDQRSAVQAEGSFSLPEGVTWSGDGTTAILHSQTGNWIQVLSGLPAMKQGPFLSLAPLGGTLSSIAADSSGKQIAIGMLGDIGGVYQLTDSGTFAVLLPGVKPIALAFSDDGKTLYALDGAANLLYELNLADSSSQTWPLDGVSDPIALISTKDASHRAVIYVAGRSDRVLKVFDSSTHEVLASIQLSFQPNVIDPLGSASFLIESRLTSEDILWTFTNAPQPAVYFVPAAPIHLHGNPLRENPEK
jgi:hypothetical protein